jgi:alpha-L-fucosidase 2
VCSSDLFALCGKAPQVDGTFGTTAAITEMLMQSHDGCIKLLPALPAEWTSGQFRGVCARGGFELNYTWDNKTVRSLRILSKAGEQCTIEMKPNLHIVSNGKQIKFKKNTNGTVSFNTIAGQTYAIE